MFWPSRLLQYVVDKAYMARLATKQKTYFSTFQNVKHVGCRSVTLLGSYSLSFCTTGDTHTQTHNLYYIYQLLLLFFITVTLHAHYSSNTDK